MIEVALALTLAFGPPSAGWTLDVHPSIVLGIPGATPDLFAPSGLGRCGFALPHVAVASLRCTMPGAARHERQHLDQYAALGPGALVAYALTGGRAIEDYLGLPGEVWYPPEDEDPRCPLVRITPDRTTFAPCWHPY